MHSSLVNTSAMMKTIFFGAAFLALGLSVLGAPAEDEVISLPGLKKQPQWKQYSGYLRVSGTRRLHYWFIESASNPMTDPVVLWMNGGPGCSSLLGLLTENGPYTVREDGVSLDFNPQSWNSIANMLYLEAPAGVGFSYSDDQNYTTDDDQVAWDNYVALKDFFSKFPEYVRNEFFITGESYGGVYVPTLSAHVQDDPSFYFQGYAIGNGVSVRELMGDSIVYFAYYHGLIGQEEWTTLLSVCCNGDATDCKFIAQAGTSAECYKEVTRVNDIINGGSFDAYNLYAPCSGGVNNYGKKHADLLDWAFHITPPEGAQVTHKVHVHQVSERPCNNQTAVTTYLSLPEVRAALHIQSNLPKWETCADYGDNWYTKIYNDTTKIHQKLLIGGARALMYNGDVDMVCNFLGDEWFVDSLQKRVVKPHGMWYYMDEKGQKQVAGFAKSFDSITYATVRGSGHMVPTDRPRSALALFTNFIRNSTFL